MQLLLPSYRKSLGRRPPPPTLHPEMCANTASINGEGESPGANPPSKTVRKRQMLACGRGAAHHHAVNNNNVPYLRPASHALSLLGFLFVAPRRPHKVAGCFKMTNLSAILKWDRENSHLDADRFLPIHAAPGRPRKLRARPAAADAPPSLRHSGQQLFDPKPGAHKPLAKSSFFHLCASR